MKMAQHTDKNKNQKINIKTMKNFKLELFNFKNRLTFDQTDISSLVEGFIINYDNFSEKELVKGINEKLLKYTYDTDVKRFLESLDTEMKSYPLVYELKDLYKRVERENQGMLYRQPLNTILEIINKADDDARMESILNELRIYDWVPQIKSFVFNLTKSPLERQNMSNSGKGEKVYTIVEKIDNGYMAFVSDRWFMIDDKEVKQILAEDYIEDEDKIKEIRILEQCMKLSTIENDKVTFKIDENVQLSLSTKNDKTMFINEEKLDAETTLENVFNSPIIPYLKRDYFLLINTLKENLNNLVELDIALKITNILNPYLESYAFNYKDKMYLYNKDIRTGSSFYAYESVNELINDVKKDLDFDLTHFFENKLSKELKQLKTLEDKEKSIELKIKDVNEAIDELKNEPSLLETDKSLKLTFDNLLVHRHNLYKELNKTKDDKIQFKKSLIR
jgi:hypothetical protein